MDQVINWMSYSDKEGETGQEGFATLLLTGFFSVILVLLMI
ncbi:MAG: hypothetical protein PHE55_19250 [Methylococcaceae bacterium]|nr:hypothetical protein [Methylococcaceae bacterium]